MVQAATRTLSDQIVTGTDTYLDAMLGWLRALLAWHVEMTRATYGELADDAYRGLYITNDEADLLVAEWPNIPPNLQQQRIDLNYERAQIEARQERTGTISPFQRLATTFGLSAFECDALLLGLAPEIDPRYERLYAYIQDDVTRKRPSVALALRLLCITPEEQLHARASFTASGPLMRFHMIQLLEDGQRQPPLLGRFIKLDDRIVGELLRHPAIDSLLASCVTLTPARHTFDDLVFSGDLIARLRRIIADHPAGLAMALQGGYGSGRLAVAEALCVDSHTALLLVDVERLLIIGMEPTEAARRVQREALLQHAAIFWQAADKLLQDPTLSEWRQAILAVLDEHQGYSFLAIEQPWEARGALRHTRFLRVKLPAPSYTGREQIWQARLGNTGPDITTIQAIASTFRLSGGQIRDAVMMAHSLAAWRTSTTPHIQAQDLYAACRAQSSGRLDSLAHKINTIYTWEDIVLPADQITMLHEICIQVRHRKTVLEHWGFDKRLAMGKGVNVLFAGQSGTGKTMSAEIIASDLGMELYKVDLSMMVSKYIGETEKNLDRIFTAAHEANAILFFDEADAIFGKRSEVKDAHDRYANIEVGYLLQKMEEYDGVVILSTNLRKNMDDAFIRRLHVAIDFPFPEETDRIRIWRKVFPVEAPLTPDVDLGFLARQFKLAGGNIRNIALLSAFLAAEDGNEIRMMHVIKATRREYQKMGKLITDADFGPYMAQIQRMP